MTDSRSRWHECLARMPPDRPLVGAEIGVWRGELSEQLLAGHALLTLHLVDLWTEHSQGPRLSGVCDPADAKQEVKRRAARFGKRVKIHHMSSVEAARVFKPATLDFVFIDARHSYAAVRQDIAIWLPKVKPGGWIGGHDYNAERPGVVRAVDEAFRTDIELGADWTWFKNLG